MLFSNVLNQVAINEVTLPYVVIIVIVFVLGLFLILGWDYIIPLIIPSFKLGECKVVDRKYIICEATGSPEKVGYMVLKIVPTQPIADMQKERRESILQTIQGLLKASDYEVMVVYNAVRDRYRENVLKRLERKKRWLLMFSTRETPAIRDLRERIESEKKLLEQQPMILEGFYLAMVRYYDRNTNALKVKLNEYAKALSAKLETLSSEVQILQGQALKDILEWFVFGNVKQSKF